jgi:hemerythrin-like domain-containing protein
VTTKATTPVVPRQLRFEDLILVLVSEHAEIERKLAQLERFTEDMDFSHAAAILKDLDRLFRQHIADEEAQVLRLLIEAYGVKGAASAISVFRQHRPIYRLMQEVGKLASLPPRELATNEAKLRALLKEHTQAEETRVFPNALSTFKSGAGRSN